MRPRQRSQFIRDLVESQSQHGCAARPSRSAESSNNGMWGIGASVASLGSEERQAYSFVKLHFALAQQALADV
jgi:hypothetical protein